MSVLAIRGLRVAYAGAEVVRGVDLTLRQGETYGLVGESGCGKSTIAYAVEGHLAESGRVTAGSIRVDGHEVVGAAEGALRRLRAQSMSMVYQDPVAALNPTMRIGAQLAEAARDRADIARVIDRVRLPDAASLLRRYPHQLSGGQLQRVVIAMALLSRPTLLMLDEPTTGLDVTVEAEVVALISEIAAAERVALLYISHNLGLMARVADRIGIMYAGQLVEEGPMRDVLGAPRHPYTRALLACLPGARGRAPGTPLPSIPGQVPPIGALPPGCAFAPRCDMARPGLCDAPGALDMVPLGPHHTARCRRLDAAPPAPGAAQGGGQGAGQVVPSDTLPPDTPPPGETVDTALAGPAGTPSNDRRGLSRHTRSDSAPNGPPVSPPDAVPPVPHAPAPDSVPDLPPDTSSDSPSPVAPDVSSDTPADTPFAVAPGLPPVVVPTVAPDTPSPVAPDTKPKGAPGIPPALPPGVSPDTPDSPLLRVAHLTRTFGRIGPFAPPPVRASDDVSFTLPAARTLALVGESGSGKSTLARMLIGLDTADGGSAAFGRHDIAALPAAARPQDLIRQIQMVFQNPDGTLNPAHRIGHILSRALKRAGQPHAPADVARLLDSVRLPADIAARHPPDLSGGQRQRVAIARAFAGQPALIVADEPVSALDVSVQAAIIGLLAEMTARHRTAILLISHDLMLVRHVADHVVVLYRGRVMEQGPAAAVFAAPSHPYTEALLASVHPPDPDHIARPLDAPDDPGAPPADGCPFVRRCHRRMAQCATTPPPLRDAGGGHAILCHHPLPDLAQDPAQDRTERTP